MKNKLLFVAATHGNEPLGAEIMESIKRTNLRKKFDFIIGNPKALGKNKRFINSDLNRIFPGKSRGNYEERRAREIVEIGQKYDYIIDIHGSASKTGIFIILTKFNWESLLFALLFDIKRIVIWTGESEVNGSLSTFMPAGFEIEAGFRDDPKIKRELTAIIINFLKKSDKKKIDYFTELKKREIYFYVGKLSKSEIKPKNLKNWKKVDGYYPLFVDGQYKDIWCYKFKKLCG